MRKITLDGNCMKSKETLHLYLKKKLNIKQYYGNNLDALWDVLALYDSNVLIVLINKDVMIDELADYGNSLIKVFKDATNINKNISFKIIKNELIKQGK